MSIRVDVEPEVLAWAIQRSGRPVEEIEKRFPLTDWRSGEVRPTLKQLEAFGAATYTPIGVLLLDTPPAQEELPLRDFRTIQDSGVSRPSANLLDTIYLCQQRQEWYQDYARRHAMEPLKLVNSLTTEMGPAVAAARISEEIGFDPEQRRQYSTWTEALAGLRELAEELGVLVMISGVVGSNTHRPLDPDEFRGFALVDELAPVVFVNGADTKAAQIFTLAHELVHVWLGESGVDNPAPNQRATISVERWCNEVAAELLVPAASLRREYASDEMLSEEMSRLARFYKVSTLVVLRSIYDAGLLTWDDFRTAYDEELRKLAEVKRGDGGDFYKSTPVRVSKRFTEAIIGDTVEGATSYGDAFRLLGFNKQSTFDELGRQVGVS